MYVLSIAEPQARSAQEKGRSRISILGGDKIVLITLGPLLTL